MTISAIVPTIGRPQSIVQLLESLCIQTERVDEVVVADADQTDQTRTIARDPKWERRDLRIRHLHIEKPNAVLQRESAIHNSSGELLLLLDDDVVLEPECVERMVSLLEGHPEVAAVTANFNNQSWPPPTRPWRLYLRYILGLKEKQWEGRVVGPLLRYGYGSDISTPQSMEWLGTGNSLIRRRAFEDAGGFSDFFLLRSASGEDVDLGLKISRVGHILFSPLACMTHNHAPGGRLSVKAAAEDDLYNRFFILQRTARRSKQEALLLIATFFLVETLSDLLAIFRHGALSSFVNKLLGRLWAIGEIFYAAVLKPGEPVRTHEAVADSPIDEVASQK